MSTHDIGFYEDLTKIIFELSSNIIKYVPYFFCCRYIKLFPILVLKCKKEDGSFLSPIFETVVMFCFLIKLIDLVFI